MSIPIPSALLRIIHCVRVFGMVSVPEVSDAFADCNLLKTASEYSDCFATHLFQGREMLALTPQGRDREAAGLSEFVAQMPVSAREGITRSAIEFESLDPACKSLITNFQHGRSLESVEAILEFHEQAAALLAEVIEQTELWQHYQKMFAHAVRMIAAGDHEYVASPKCMSYHTLWHAIHFDQRIVSSLWADIELV